MHNDIELTAVREQHQFDQLALQTYLQENLNFDFSEMQILQFEGGQSNPTFQLKTPDGNYVLRKKPPGVLLKSAHAVDREYRVMSALQASAVPVPKTYLLCEDESIIGTAFYLMEMVEGRVLLDTSLPLESPAARTALTYSFIESLVALHTVDINEVGLSDFGKPSDYYARQIHRWSGQYLASETETDPAMQSLIEWLPDNIPQSDEVSIIHGDYRIPNCIIDSDKPQVSAILDWELSTIGHPFADLAYWCATEFYSDGPRKVLAQQAGSGLISEQEAVDYYCKISGRDGIENWPFYIIFNLFRSGAIMQGVYKRGLDGNASSDRWRSMHKLARNCATQGWQLVQTNY